MEKFLTHNPKVTGSSPVPATEQDASSNLDDAFLLIAPRPIVILEIRAKTELISEVRYCRFIGSMTIPEGNTNFCILIPKKIWC